MRFLADSMLLPSTAGLLEALGHEATTPAQLGVHNLPDDVLARLAGEEGLVIVTENASDFSAVTECPVLFVLKSWWSPRPLATSLASAVDRWALTNPEPGNWAHWLPAELRSNTAR